ncbi:hemicentin-1-like isoform X2 [Bradysia coprophila]|uniref:hemicentin-1-like isoform X2 n=1 Tax=Bradysia coprophila TaxID=38358 RepID=UPI00187D7B78|nr:hemicentin-1-like isoform X2 [Bradysia coprophila]
MSSFGSFVVSLILLLITLLVTSTNSFNLSTVDKDELWHLLLNRQISNNISDAFHSSPPLYNDNGDDLTNAVVVSDKVNEFPYDVVDGNLSDDGVKVEYDDENKTVDKSLQSQIMDIFNVSVVDSNKTETADDIIRENVGSDTVVVNDGVILSDRPYVNENLKLKRDEESLTTTPSIIAIDVFKPSETEGNSDDEAVLTRSKVSVKPRPGQTSLVIVFDGTGSMENCLIQLRAGAKQIIDKFAERNDNPIYNYIFVPFRDPHVGPELVTTNQTELLDVLDNLKLYGGGDCPESTLKGIFTALKYALPKSYVYVFTDAIAKDFALDLDVLSLIQRRQATLTFLLTGFCKSKDSPGYEVFERLAASSNGQVYNLKTQEIKDVLEDIKNSLDQRRVSLKYLDSNAADEHSIDVSIDENLKEFSVSVAGLNPNISVIDPKKELYEKGKKVLDLENLKVVNVENPIPGEWNVIATSDSAHSVRLTAISDIVFNFGFTLKPPQTISETFFNPLKDELNVLSISPSNNTLIHNLTSVQISLFYDKNNIPPRPIIFSLELEKTQGEDGADDLYITKPFQPPRQPFKIDIKGFDLYGNPLQRLLSTVLQSSEESPPEVFIENDSIEVDEMATITINCQVKSLIPMLVQLKWHDRVLEEVKVDQTTSLKLNLEEVTGKDSGRYVCSAVNRRGYSEGSIDVTVRPRRINVTIPIPNYTIVENETDIAIYCEASQKDAEITWSFSNGNLNDLDVEVISSHLLLKKVTRNYTGIYTCAGRSIYGDSASDATNVTVLYATEIIGDSFQFEAIQYNEQLNLHCPVNGVPKPVKLWYKKRYNETIELPFTENVKIKNFQSHDEGIYVCEAKNQIGVSQEIKYHVTGRADVAPSILKSNPSTVRVRLGDDVKVHCQCGLCMPLTEFNWFFNEQQNSHNIFIGQHLAMGEIGNNSARLDLEILNVTERNSGEYICRFKNDYGYDEIVVRVEVLSPPQIENLSIENPFHVKDKDVIVAGSSSHIKCAVKGKPLPTIRWWKDGIPIVYDGRIFANDNGTLTVTETRVSDAGVYQCQAANPAGIIAQNFTLLVVAPPKFTTNSDPKKTVIKGSNVTLPCQVDALPPASISWMKNGRELIGDRYSIEDGGLSFRTLSMDSGIYQCIAMNEIGSATQELVLVIYVPPKIVPEDDEIIEVQSKGNAIIKCDATGFPSPTISWSFQGRSRDHYDSIDYLDEGRIRLRNLTQASEGGFVCNAFNDAGRAQKVFYIVVNDPPIITSNFPTNLTVLPGEKVNIKCEAIGNPTPLVYWELQEDGSANEDFHYQRNNVLYVDASQPSSRHSLLTYICFARNSIGSDRKQITLNLIDVPQMINDSPLHEIQATKDVLMYGDIELKCPYKNYDKLNWFKNNKPIGHISHQQREDRLQLSMVMPETSGNYMCIVQNEAGSANYTYKINVLTRPHILDIDERLTNEIPKNVSMNNAYEIMVARGEPVDINCLADGNPQPDITWKRNNDWIANSTMLSIKFASLSDSGLYVCEATNIVGTDSLGYNVEVYSEPIYEKGDYEQYLDVSINEKFRLDCEMVGRPQPVISWTKNGMPMRGVHNPILEIFPVDQSAKGLYKCEGRNRFGVEEVTFDVTIFGKPIITYTSPNATIYSTDKLKLTCQAFGIPKPILTWHYNGQLLLTTARIHYDNAINSTTTSNNNKIYINQYSNGINTNSFPLHNRTVDFANISEMKRYYGVVTHHVSSASSSPSTINTDEITFDLMLPSTAKKRSGKFSCSAANAIGRDEKHSFVKVLVYPTFKNAPTINRHIDVLQGMPIFLPCSASGHPRPDIYWFKDLIELRMDDNVKLIEDGQMLTILASSVENAGQYSCLAKNVAGEARLSFDVQILVPPSMSSTNSAEVDPFSDDTANHIQANEGDMVQLNCPVTGYPIPQITWIKLKYAGHYVDEIQPNNSTKLIISNITDFSTYTCFANSSFGEMKLVFHITVHKPPRLHNADDKSVNIKMYHGFTLRCRVDAVPEATISWFKDGQLIEPYGDNQFLSSDGQFLRIISAQRSHSGFYLCYAKNKQGAVQKAFTVDVQESFHWSPWGFWSECNTLCGPGIRIRSRDCLQSNGEPANSNNNCVGEATEIQPCELFPCAIDGDWSPWSAWSPCSHSCVEEHSNFESIRQRYRRCDSPVPQLGGRPCLGSEIEQQICSVPFCPINGGWSRWYSWSACSATCGTGTKIRTRNCDNPSASHGGEYCEGNNSESAVCSVQSCAVDGGWSDWSPWTMCSKTCGMGQKYRRRECNSPKPINGGAVCEGSNFEMKNCKIHSCRNADLVKSARVSNYAPFITIPSSDRNDKSDDYYYDDDDDSNIEYLESRPAEHVPPPSYSLENQSPQKVIVRVENYIPLSEDTAQVSISLGRNMKPVTLSHPVSCDIGYQPHFGHCQDIDECTAPHLHKCSHTCANTAGSYRCQCPTDMELADDMKTCTKIHSIYNTPQHDNPSPTTSSFTMVKYAQMVCADGFILENETCLDIDECYEMADDCSVDQKCLNTKGSYLCIPTPCPDDYNRDNFSGQCIQICSQELNGICTENAQIAQTISYTILSLKSINFDVPILKLVNYDVNRKPLEKTNFSFVDQSAFDTFWLETIPNRMGIVYLYAKQTIERAKVYQIKVLGLSYNGTSTEEESNLLYRTNFVIYVYWNF